MSKLERIRDALGAVIVSGVLFGLVPGLVTEYIKRSYLLAAVSVILVIVSYFLLGVMIDQATRKARATLEMEQLEGLEPRRGLIVFSSPGSRITPAENAIKCHIRHLQHCWIIAGPDRSWTKPHSRENAVQIVQRSQALNPGTKFHMKELDDEHNPAKAYHLLQSIYHEALALGLTETDMIADYTGGTASMSVGMALACSTSEDRDAEYMKALQQTPAGTATPASEAVPVLVDLRFGAKH